MILWLCISSVLAFLLKASCANIIFDNSNSNSLESEDSTCSSLCNIPSVWVESIEDIIPLGSQPVIYKYQGRRNVELTTDVQKEHIIAEYGKVSVKLTSSNAYSHGLKTSSLGEYIDGFLDNSSKDVSSANANETFYLFGKNEGNFPFTEFASMYDLPPNNISLSEDSYTTIVTGLGGENSGVSFHLHGPGLSESIIGRKRWFLYSPEYQPIGGFSSLINTTVIEWANSPNFASVERVPSSLSSEPGNSAENEQAQRKNKGAFFDCTIAPGEVLYFPSQWMHATLNKDDYNFFVSVFL